MGYHSKNVGFDSHRTTTYTGKGGKNGGGNGRYGGGNYGYGYGGGYGGYDDYYEDYYGGNFSWGNFGGFSTVGEDDDKDLVIKNHPSYFTPKSTDISSKLDWNADTKDNRDLIKEMSRFFYYKMLEEKDYFDPKYDDLSALNEKEIEMIAAKQQMYNDLWDRFVPGMSPLEKALFVFKELERKAGGPKGKMTPKDLERSEEINVNSEVYGDPIYNELLDENMFGKSRKFEILNKIAMIKNFGSEFKIQKEVEEKVVANSHITAHRMMRDYSQMNNVELYQRLMPNFPTKLLTKDLIVRVPVDRTEHKQKIIMLLDYSGSMNEQDKQEWVVALLIDRLKYAMKEEAEIFFSYFLSDTSYMKFKHIYDRKTALEFWASFSTRPSGGGTELGDMVNFINYEINVRHKLCNLDIDLSKDQPEILAINDGNDSVGTDGFEYKTNAISLRQANEELKRLCIANKGKYIAIYNNSLSSFNKDGEQKTYF